MKTLGQVSYEISVVAFEKLYGCPLCTWEKLPVNSQLVWEYTAIAIRAAEGPFREVDLSGQAADFERIPA